MLWNQVDPHHQRLLQSVAEAPVGPSQVAAAESALAEVRADDSFAAELLARIALVEALFYVPDQPSTLTHMAWLRQAVEHPLVGDDHATRHKLHWVLKWAPNLMLALPQISLDDVEQALDDLEEVYRRGGFALRPVLGYRARIAAQKGDADAVRRLVARWVAEPRDELSDCLACDTASQGLVWERVDAARATEAWRPLFDGTQRCGEEPQRALAHDALLRLADADPEAALARVRSAWQLAKDESMNNEAVAHCLVAWTRMGNVDRALPALLDRIDWLDEISALTERMAWTGAAVLVLDAAEAAGSAPETVGGVPLAVRRDEWRRTALEIAASFDERNDNTRNRDRLADWWDLDQVSPRPVAPPTAIPSSRATPSRPASIGAHADALRAEMDAYGGAVPRMLRSWLHHREALLREARAEDEPHIAFLDRHAARGAAEPAVLLDRADRAAREARLPEDVLRIEAERLSLLAEEGPARVERLIVIAEELDRRGAHRDAGAVWRTAARLTDSPEEGERLCLRAAESAVREGDASHEGLALLEAARGVAAEPDRAAAHLARARRLLDDRPQLLLMVEETEARLLASTGRPEDAVDLLVLALAPHTAPDTTPDTAIACRLLLCELLVDLERMDELLGASDRALADAVALEDPVVLAVAQRFHGLALVECGRAVEALELLDAALPVLQDQLPHLVGPLRWAHANALAALGEAGPARVSYAAAATAFEAEGRVHEAAHAQLQAGNQSWDAGDLEAADAHFGAAAGFADAYQDLGLFVQASRNRAMVRSQSGAVDDLEELDSVMDEAAARLEAWQVDPAGFDLAAARAQLLRDGAVLLGDVGRVEEAALRMEEAERSWPSEDGRWLLRAERGVLLARGGHVDAADQLIRPALASPEAQQAPDEVRARLVMRWAAALDHSGHTDAADRVWHELGPDE